MEHDYQTKAESKQPDGLMQNFFIFLPNEGAIPAAAGGAQTENLVRAIRTALGAGTPDVQQPIKQATLQEVALEWFDNNVASWAPTPAD